MVEDIVGEQPEYIIWKKGNRMLNYDTERGGIRYVLLQRYRFGYLHKEALFFNVMFNYGILCETK